MMIMWKGLIMIFGDWCDSESILLDLINSVVDVFYSIIDRAVYDYLKIQSISKKISQT